jgi:hypothetical protein
MLAAGVRPSTELAVAAGLELGPVAASGWTSTCGPAPRTSTPPGTPSRWRTTSCPGPWLIPLAGPANRQGRVVADNLCGRATTFGAVQGTAVVKVFDMVAGGTGANQKQLEAAGIPFERVHLHPSGHAGYYPGTASMHLKLLFAPDTGRLLGAGIVGFDGVDKRLDVLATAIRAGLTSSTSRSSSSRTHHRSVPRRTRSTWPASSPPTCSAATSDLWYASDYPAATEGARIIDVRGPEEFAAWHLPEAENVPLPTLRGPRRTGTARSRSACTAASGSAATSPTGPRPARLHRRADAVGWDEHLPRLPRADPGGRPGPARSRGPLRRARGAAAGVRPP